MAVAPGYLPATRCSSARVTFSVFGSSSTSSTYSSSARLVSVGNTKSLRIQTNSSTNSLVSRRKEPRHTYLSRNVACDAQNSITPVPVVDDSSWEELVLKAKVPVLVDFWAPWCGPCRVFQPIIEELFREYAGKFKFYSVNVDENSSVAQQYQIKSIPTVIIFKDGQKKDSVIGAVPKSTLVNCLEKLT